MEFLYLKSTNDNNGNSRRLFLLVSDGEALAVWPEGYSGSDAVPGELRERAWRAQSFPVAIGAAEYRRFLKALPSPAYYRADCFGSARQVRAHFESGVLS
jgi:hypothetical protein